MTAAVTGAISGAVTFGIGEWMGSVNDIFLRATYSALLHGTFNGMMSGIQGGKFWSGFASGALSSIASSLWGGGVDKKMVDGKIIKTAYKGISGHLGLANGAGTIIFGTISGGAGAELTGGNFWQGAATGFMVSALNHVAHEAFDKKYKFHVMLDENGARGAGHHAIAVELDNGKYRFISKNGTADPNDANFSGPSEYTDQIFDSIDAIQEYYGTEITPGHSFNKIDTYLMTKGQTNIALKVGLSVAKQDYHLLTNSCTTLVTESLSAAYDRKIFYLFDRIPNVNHALQRFNYRSNYSYSKEY